MKNKRYNPSTTSKTTSITFRCPNQLKAKIDDKIKMLNDDLKSGSEKINQTEWLILTIENALLEDQKDLD